MRVRTYVAGLGIRLLLPGKVSPESDYASRYGANKPVKKVDGKGPARGPKGR